MLRSSKKLVRLAKSLTASKRLLPFFLFAALLIVGVWLAWPTILVEIDSFAQQAREFLLP